MSGKSYYDALLRKLSRASMKSINDITSVISGNPLPVLRAPSRKQRSLFQCDIISTCMLPDDDYDEYVAAETLADGNCLYNAASMHLAGNTSMASEMRCRAIYELVENNGRYMNMHTMCLYYDPPNPEYISNVCSNGRYSGVLEVAVCANVIGADIHLVYPDVNQGIRPYFHREFKAEFYVPNRMPMRVMFTRAGSMRDHKKTFWDPNHFAYLVPPNACKGKTCWPSQRDKWLEVKQQFEGLQDLLRDAPPMTIDLVHDEGKAGYRSAKNSSMALSDALEYDRSNGYLSSCTRDIGLVKDDNHVKVSSDSINRLPEDKADTFVNGTNDAGVPKEIMDVVATDKLPSDDKVIEAAVEMEYNDDILSDENSNRTASYADLIGYAVKNYGIDELSPVTIKEVGSNLKTNREDDIIYVNTRTTQPTGKGWGKYQVARKPSTQSDIEVIKRKCSRRYMCHTCNKRARNNKITCCGTFPAQIDCQVELLYITRTNGSGTLIVPQGTHNSLCTKKVNIAIMDTHAFDGIPDYFGHGVKHVYEAKTISDINEADGDQMYQIDVNCLPYNTKPIGRNWKHTCTYRTPSSSWRAQQRRCTNCPAIIRYIRSNNIEQVFLQHIGWHTCGDAPPAKVRQQTPTTSDTSIHTAIHTVSKGKHPGESGIMFSDIGRNMTSDAPKTRSSSNHMCDKETGIDDDDDMEVDIHHKLRSKHSAKDMILVTASTSTQHLPISSAVLDGKAEMKSTDTSIHTQIHSVSRNKHPDESGVMSLDIGSNMTSDAPKTGSSCDHMYDNENGIDDDEMEVDIDHKLGSENSAIDMNLVTASTSTQQLPLWSAILDGKTEVKSANITEDELKAMDCCNWGKRDLSNRKLRIYKRHCKGAYVCPVCGEYMKRSKKCRKCHSVASHVDCMAVIFYKLNEENVFDLRHDGVHTCRVKSVSNKPMESTSKAIDTDSLPFDIDGDIVYNVNIEKGENPWARLTDGRKWGPYKKVSGDKDITIYRRTCMGRPACYSNECHFFRRFKERNWAQFELQKGVQVCRECGELVKTLPCSAKKSYAMSKTKPDNVVINHTGSHACIAIKNMPVPQQEIEELTTKFPNIKPAVAANTILRSKLINDAPSEEMDNIAAGLLKQAKVQKTKDNVRRKLYPHGTNVQAVRELKDSLMRDNKDDFFIYNVDTDPTRVLTSSKEKLQIACELSGMGNELWPTLAPYAHVDFHPSRVCGMTVLGVQCYHPVLKQVVCLFKYYAEQEVSGVVEDALNCFNAAVCEYSDGACQTFDPAGWMSDEAGSILKALEVIYGPEVHTKLTTCQAHYKMAVHRMQRYLGTDIGNDFASVAYAMEHALTAALYEQAKQRLCDLIDGHVKKNKLVSWLNWWDCRKSHWALAYRPTNNAPLNNLSECVHAWEKARGSVTVMLLEAVHDDITTAITLKSKVDGYREGWYTGGSGKSLIDMANISSARQMQRAKVYATTLNTPPRTSCQPFVVDPSATHREDKSRDDLTGQLTHEKDISSDGNSGGIPTISSDTSERRPSKRRDMASKLFEKVKYNAVTQYPSYNIMEDNENTNDKRQRKFVVFKKNFQETEDYLVTVAVTPSCGCLFFIQNKGKQICKHIVMVMLSLGVDKKDQLLYQIGYTETELSVLLTRKLLSYQDPPNEPQPAKRLRHRLYLSNYEKGHRPGKRPRCPTCKEAIEDGLVVEIFGRYRCKQYSADNTFRFHLRDDCLKTPPHYSDISTMPHVILRGHMCMDDVANARSMVNFPIN